MGGLRKDIQMIDSDTLASRGFVVAPGLIGPAECRALASLWPEKPNFRSHVVMQRHEGEQDGQELEDSRLHRIGRRRIQLLLHDQLGGSKHPRPARGGRHRA